MRKSIFAGNWKMQMGPHEATKYLNEFIPQIHPDKSREWIIFAPFVSLPTLQNNLKNTPIKWGGQNCHHEPKGAFTGEISAPMLKELDCQYGLVGHSERRQFFGETDKSCALKIKALLESDITPMLCVGETQKERDGGMTQEIIKSQIEQGLEYGDPLRPLVIAYEPVWAIGTGKVATAGMAEEVHVFIRKVLSSKFGQERAGQIQILYGGSVKPENCRELIALPNIDGFLIGGASLTAKSFAQIGLIPL